MGLLLSGVVFAIENPYVIGIAFLITALMFLFLAGLFGIIFGLIWKIFKKNDYFPFAPALIFSYLLLIYFC